MAASPSQALAARTRSVSGSSWRGGSFLTLLYCYDGQLRELFMEEGTGLQPGDGTPLLPLDGLSVTACDGVMTLTVTLPEQGATRQVSLAPRCGIKEDYGL